MRSVFRQLSISFVAGVISGTIILGLGGRILMRLIAVLNETAHGFSWGGTLEVILLGSIIGSIAGICYGLIGFLIKRNVILTGIVTGLFTYAAILLLPIEGKGAALGFPELQTFIYLSFGVLFLLFGICLTIFYSLLVKAWGRWLMKFR